MNKVILIGNISTDIDLKATPNGHYVAKFNLAANHPFKKDIVNFVPIETWRKQAENTAQFCSKGSKVAIDGYLQIDQYEKDGQKRTFTKVVADSITFLDSKPKQNNQQSKNDPFANEGEEIGSDQLPF